LGHETLELRSLLSGSPWQNPMSCDDMNGDGTLSPADALVAINAINAGMTGPLAGAVTVPTADGSTSDYLDANGDGQLSPADPLMVINAINSGKTSDDTTGDDPSPVDQPGQIGSDVPALTLTNGFARARGAIDTDGDVDVFQVTASAAQLNVALFSRASGDVTVSIEDAAGNILATASTADDAPLQPATTTLPVDAGTTYYLVVSGASGVTGPYCLQVINSDEIATPPEGDSGGDGSGSGDTPDPTTDHPAPPTPAQLFTKLDTNADGSLTLTEFEALPAPKDATETPDAVFSQLDADASGTLSLTEFTALFAKPNGGSDLPGPGSFAQRPPGAPPAAPPTAEALFTKLDTNADGSLSETEFTSFIPPSSRVAADKVFAAWDTDTSGVLSLAEFKAGLATLKRPSTLTT
jgi:hypothetical protein